MFDSSFTDLNIQDMEVGATLFKNLRLSTAALTDPAMFSKLRTIVDYLNNDVDPLWTIETIVRSNKNPATPAIEHMFNYVKIKNEMADYKRKIEKLDSELSTY